MKARTSFVDTYCERCEGQAHAPEAVESQGDEDQDREFWKRNSNKKKKSHGWELKRELGDDGGTLHSPLGL